MTDEAAPDAAVTGIGRRRPGTASPRRGEAAGPTTPDTGTATPATPASHHAAASPDDPVPGPTTAPADATGLGIRRTGSQPSAEAATSMVRVHRAESRPATESETSVVDVASARADATGLARRRAAPATPAPTPSGPVPAPPDATGLGHRRPGPAPGPGSPHRTAPPRGPAATGYGARGPAPAPRGGPPGGVMRFGPGGPAPSGPRPTPPATPTWQPHPGAARPAGPPPRKRRGPVVGGMFTLLAVAAVLAYLFLWPTAPVGIQGVTVAADPAEAGCGATVVLVGTVATDGTAGSFTYQWERSDGQIGEVLTQSVAGGTTSSDVRLQWTVSGEGSFEGSATLRVLDGVPASPDAATGTGGFTYAC